MGESASLKLAARAGLVLAAWTAALAIENLAIGFGYRRMFVASFEMGVARTAVSPLLVAAGAPLAVFAVLFLDSARARRAWPAAFAAIFGALVAYGVSHGRHLQSLGVRAPFVLALALAAAALVRYALPRVLAAPPWIALLAAAPLWCADAFVLPRLYPAFHEGLFVLTLGAIAVLGWAGESKLGLGALGFAAACAAWTPFGVKALWRMDNLRMVLVDHAPMLGRGVRLATSLWPPPEAAGEARAFGEVTRSLDWSGKDIVLLSVDALRADHVGAYGYARATTPRIDALAREGAIFEAAYCATPHTSYSVTSMLTGKYMRPLLALGLGEDSLTLASYARTYGYHTAAFYPPAVFFIDEQRFQSFEDRGLDFEYRKVEFASPSLRREQVRAYLDEPANQGKPTLLWVHFFEPHEPYVAHAEHPFGDKELDAYDSEIAAADEGIGMIVDEVRARRPSAIFIVTADHGEEFGDHGGRYHGTTVYDEQVRVPLVVAGAGVAHARVRAPVQTIDVVPTVLSALGVPRPARLRGRDIGALAAGRGSSEDPGFAFAETDDQTLLAERALRLVCAKRAGACALYDTSSDPGETKDVSAARAADVARLKGTLVATAQAHGKYEIESSRLPEALRRGAQGEIDADADVAALLDDADVEVRRRAAAVLYDLKSTRVTAQLRRAAMRDEDGEVKRWSSLALARAGESSAAAEALLVDPDPSWRRLAALAFAERGDGRGDAELAAWWSDRGALDFVRARDVLRAIGARKVKAAVPALIASLDDVRLRPYVVDALGAIGDASARAPLAKAFAVERYANARVSEGRALAALGAKDDLFAPLAAYAGAPDPMLEAVAIAKDAKLLEPKRGGWTDGPSPEINVELDAPAGPARLFVLLADGGELEARVDGAPVALPPREGLVRYADLTIAGPRARVFARAKGGIAAAWLVRRTP